MRRKRANSANTTTSKCVHAGFEKMRLDGLTFLRKHVLASTFPGCYLLCDGGEPAAGWDLTSEQIVEEKSSLEKV